jgi:hypothetical protein
VTAASTSMPQGRSGAPTVAQLRLLLGVRLADVRAAVSEQVAGPAQLELGSSAPPLRFRGYMTITHMRQAIAAMGVEILGTETDLYEFVLRRRPFRPHVRIVCVAFDGPWSANPMAAASHRHFIAALNGMVYDVNSNDWMPAYLWEDNAHLLYPKRATGHTFTWAADLRDAKAWR